MYFWGVGNQPDIAVGTTNHDNRSFLQLARQIKTAEEGNLRLHNKPQTSYRSAYCQFTQLYFCWNVSLCFQNLLRPNKWKWLVTCWWWEEETLKSHDSETVHQSLVQSLLTLCELRVMVYAASNIYHIAKTITFPNGQIAADIHKHIRTSIFLIQWSNWKSHKL